MSYRTNYDMVVRLRGENGQAIEAAVVETSADQFGDTTATNETIYFGATGPIFGVPEYLLRALAEVSERFPRADFEVHGQGETIGDLWTCRIQSGRVGRQLACLDVTDSADLVPYEDAFSC